MLNFSLQRKILTKLPFRDAQDGISNTFSIVPNALGKDGEVMFSDLDLDDIVFENPVDCACCADASADESAVDRQ